MQVRVARQTGRPEAVVAFDRDSAHVEGLLATCGCHSRR